MNTDEYLIMEAKEEATAAFIRNLLKETDFSVEKIASFANVTVEFVNEVKDNKYGAR